MTKVLSLLSCRTWSTTASWGPSVACCPSSSWMARRLPTPSSSSRLWPTRWRRTWTRVWTRSNWVSSMPWWPWSTTICIGKWRWRWLLLLLLLFFVSSRQNSINFDFPHTHLKREQAAVELNYPHFGLTGLIIIITTAAATTTRRGNDSDWVRKWSFVVLLWSDILQCTQFITCVPVHTCQRKRKWTLAVIFEAWIGLTRRPLRHIWKRERVFPPFLLQIFGKNWKCQSASALQ